jgi:hypothetical protein
MDDNKKKFKRIEVKNRLVDESNRERGAVAM